MPLDLDLAQRCLEGDEAAVKDLCQGHVTYLSKLLYGYGASDADAAEMVSDLWMDCFAGNEGQEPLLTRYNGSAPLRSWLGAILVNRWISRKRRDSVHARAIDLIKNPSPAHAVAFETESLVDANLADAIERAVRHAFTACTAEDLVLLQLVHVHDITQRELSTLLGCHESGISRRLKKAEEFIAAETLQCIRRYDGWLDVQWEDFLRLCESTNILRMGA